jgi:hypothetical protein
MGTEGKSERDKNLDRAKEAKEWAEKHGDDKTVEAYGNVLDWIERTEDL